MIVLLVAFLFPLLVQSQVYHFSAIIKNITKIFSSKSMWPYLLNPNAHTARNCSVNRSGHSTWTDLELWTCRWELKGSIQLSIYFSRLYHSEKEIVLMTTTVTSIVLACTVQLNVTWIAFKTVPSLWVQLRETVFSDPIFQYFPRRHLGLVTCLQGLGTLREGFSKCLSRLSPNTQR